MTRRERLPLANLPTPLERHERLGSELGIQLWVKRDDASAGVEAGNKIRKLEFLLSDAVERGSDTVITCGGEQSNHARATAVAAARLGLRTVLVLRSNGLEDDDEGRGVAPQAASPRSGNLLIDFLVGAEIRFITPASYRRSNDVMAALAQRLRDDGAKPYVIPEGGSNGLGALGYVEAMAEIRAQLDSGLAEGKPFDLIVHACGSGGTAAGTILGAGRHRVAEEVWPMAVCDDAASFEQRIAAIMDECRALAPELDAAAAWHVDDSALGPAYGVMSLEQQQRLVAVARRSGLVLDPVYSGKAFAGLCDRCDAGGLFGKRVLFLHTGGLPGLLAQNSTFSALM
jgi:D-cysteine desulfhydrase